MNTTEEEPRSYFSLPYINTGKITVKPSAGRDGYVSLVFADDLTLWTNSAGFARELVKAAAEALRLLDPPKLDSGSWECQRCHGMYIGHRPDGDVCDHCQMLAEPVDAPDPEVECSKCHAADTPTTTGADGEPQCWNLTACANRRVRDAAKASTP